MYKVDIPLDTKESAAIERRRNMEAARKSRIFDATQRTIGVDVNALDAQVDDSRNRAESDKRRHEAYAALMIRNDKTAQLLDNRNERLQEQINRDMEGFRATNQRKETRREFDLNDPEYLKKSTPMGMNEHGVSSLQSFVGEDIHHTDRTKVQKEQIREWSLQLQKEREASETDRRTQDQIYDLKRIQLDNKAVDLQTMEESERQAEIKSTKAFNLALAEEQRRQRENSRNLELAQNKQEILNQVLGDTLTENPEVARSAFGSHRVIPDRWKGMSDAELADIRQVQEAQRQENLAKKNEESMLRNEWSNQQIATAKAGILLDREAHRNSVSERKRLDQENAALAGEQKGRKKHLDDVVYTNVPNDGYYTQFNTTSR